MNSGTTFLLTKTKYLEKFKSRIKSEPSGSYRKQTFLSSKWLGLNSPIVAGFKCPLDSLANWMQAKLYRLPQSPP
jgi:hypothetical protein